MLPKATPTWTATSCEEGIGEQLVEWEKALAQLFPAGIPTTCVWEGFDCIRDVLCHVAVEQLNYVRFPTGGGLDLSDVKDSHEDGCLEFDFQGTISILKPRRLTFESVGEHEWSCFLLETHELQRVKADPSGRERGREALTELTPGEYVEFEVYEDGECHGEPLPSSARRVSRELKGSWLIMGKGSPLNTTQLASPFRALESTTFRPALMELIRGR